MARMNAPGGHDRTGLLHRAKQLLRRRKNDPPPVVRPPGLARMKGGINLPEKPAYVPKAPRVYIDVAPLSRADSRHTDHISRRQEWALILPVHHNDIEIGTMATYSRRRRPLMKLSREAGVLPILVDA